MKQLTIIFISLILTTGCMAQEEEPKKRNVAVFIYDGVEILDFAGPAEVFASSTKKGTDGDYQFLFNVYTVAATKESIESQGFIDITPDYSIKGAPKPDIIVLPGGSTRKSRGNPEVISWIKESAETAEVLLSVCTGAFLLGDADLLNGLKATTWYGAVDRLKDTYPATETLENVRFVDNGQIVTTAGVSAGIDGALHVVGRLHSLGVAEETAKYMEYDKWEPNAGVIVSQAAD